MQLALIVDDSKTARLLLRKMLARYDIPVAMVESGEEALEYLQDNHPDVIFMDHMMPGMDGFDTVKVIKNDTATAAIPIVMHTTRQGDIYVGQARALGAVDILSKPASAEDLEQVLARVEVARESASVAPKAAAQSDAEPPVDNDAPPTIPVVEIASLETPSFLGTARQWLLAVIWLIPTLWLLSLYLVDQATIKQLKQQQLKTLAAIEVLMNRQPVYDYGELAMSGGRLALLEAVVPLLQQANFSGVLRIEGHVGNFCLSRVPLADGNEVMMLPPPEWPLAACDVIGSSSARAMRQSIDQSPAFVAFIEAYQAQSGAIRIEVAPYGSNNPAYPYPIDLGDVTVGDWNAVALDNNRVNFVLIPD